MGSGNKYILNDPDLQYFINNTKFDREIQNVGLICTFLKYMKYNLNYGGKKSSKFNKINYSFQPQLGSGLYQYTRVTSPSRSLTCIFLQSDPDELVDQLKLIVLEKVEGNDNPLLIEQIIAIVDKLLEYECITTNQHQKIISAINSKRSVCGLNNLYSGLDSLQIIYFLPFLSSNLFIIK